MTSILAIDSGNSYVKWGCYSDNHWLSQNSVYYKNISNLHKEFDNLLDPEIILISHVARKETEIEIRKLISRWPIEPHWLHSSLFQSGVFNGYSNPNQLGSDRWAALIAAWNIEHKPCLVINAGTAVTVDSLSGSGKFLGGVILPGIHLMLRSLLSGTQLTADKTGFYEDFPLNTDDAIYSGMIQCIVGAIERMYTLLSLQLNNSTINCILSGGNASFLAPFIKLPTKVIDNLVLEGLVVIAKDNIQNQNFSAS